MRKIQVCHLKPLLGVAKQTSKQGFIMSYTKTEPNGDTCYSDGEYWFNERELCRHCSEEREANSQPFRMADIRLSFGIYAGLYCDECWKTSGYRDATDPDAQFDPMDAGEAYWEDDY